MKRRRRVLLGRGGQISQPPTRGRYLQHHWGGVRIRWDERASVAGGDVDFEDGKFVGAHEMGALACGASPSPPALNTVIAGVAVAATGSDLSWPVCLPAR